MISSERPSESTSVWRTRSIASAIGFGSPSNTKPTVIVRAVCLTSSIRAPAARIRCSTWSRWRSSRAASSASPLVVSVSFTCTT